MHVGRKVARDETVHATTRRQNKGSSRRPASFRQNISKELQCSKGVDFVVDEGDDEDNGRNEGEEASASKEASMTGPSPEEKKRPKEKKRPRGFLRHATDCECRHLIGGAAVSFQSLDRCDTMTSMSSGRVT